MASLTQLLERMPTKLKRWQLSGACEGAHMALGPIASHYPMMKLSKVCQGVAPQVTDLEGLAVKMEPAAWDLASHCPLDEHMNDLSAEVE